MKIALAQFASVRGDIAANLTGHQRFVQRAGALGIELLVFPELSISQYEPTLVDAVALQVDDPRLLPLQALADSYGMTIGVGMPVRREAGIVIGMMLLAPGKPRQIYSKRYLHADEEPYFVPEHSAPMLARKDGSIGFAICYEISVAQHAQDTHGAGAAVYVASVAKTPAGVVKAHTRLAEIAREYRMTVFMANCVGECEGKPAGGRSAVWDARGTLLASLGENEEGLLVYDPALPGRAPETIRL